MQDTQAEGVTLNIFNDKATGVWSQASKHSGGCMALSGIVSPLFKQQQSTLHSYTVAKSAKRLQRQMVKHAGQSQRSCNLPQTMPHLFDKYDPHIVTLQSFDEVRPFPYDVRDGHHAKERDECNDDGKVQDHQ